MSQKIIIDVGACVGKFFERYLDEDVLIYAFEPLSVNFNHLKEKYGENKKVTLYPHAVSNFNGSANFYKKYKIVDGKRQYDYLTCAGSSLYRQKVNVDEKVFDKVRVIKLSTFVKNEKIEKIAILKIDAEGAEYDVLGDVIDSGLYKIIDKIHYEDHSYKCKVIRFARDKIRKKIEKLGIKNKFVSEWP